MIKGSKGRFFTVLILTVVPVLAIALAAGALFFHGSAQQWEQAQPAFSQLGSTTNLLLMDKQGSAFMLCLVSEEKTDLISILADSCLPVSGKDSVTVAQAYKQGGKKLLQSCITENFGLPVHGCLEMDFSRTAPVIDAIGGVELEGKTVYGKEFVAYLAGSTVSPQGAQRQRTALLSVAEKMCTAGFWKVQKGARKLIGLMDSDLGFSKLTKVGKKLMNSVFSGRIYGGCIPLEGTYQMEQQGTAAVRRIDVQKNREYLQGVAGLEIISYSRD